MSKIWFTADQHFGHENIIAYAKRPFKNIKEHDAEIIERHNAVVKPGDVVFMLGDFTMAGHRYHDKVTKMVKKLHGKKVLILGNHDRFYPKQYLTMGFQEVHTALGYKEFYMIHDACMRVTERFKSVKILCGHIHQCWKSANNALNIGVDVWNYTPVSLEKVRSCFEGFHLNDYGNMILPKLEHKDDIFFRI